MLTTARQLMAHRAMGKGRQHLAVVHDAGRGRLHGTRDGSVELTASYPGAEQGSVLRWKSVSASKGFVDLNQTLGYAENAVAYAYCEIESIHPRETVLKCGSDDGIKVWINGQVVHQWEGQRGHAPGSDQQAIHLEAGVNRVLVKSLAIQRRLGL
jgi:hypothetical protein